jgi:hypothetical protein
MLEGWVKSEERLQEISRASRERGEEGERGSGRQVTKKGDAGSSLRATT